jgi:hypothetical protein
MKKYFNIVYWTSVVLLLSGVFMSTTKNYSSSLLLAVAILPGVIFAKFFFSDISFTGRWRGIYHLICLAMIVLLVEYLSILFVDLYLVNYALGKNADIIFNPFFIWLLTVAFLSLEKLLENKIESGPEADKSRFIEFTSDRKKVSLEIESIIYIESKDDEVWVRTLTDTSYRTKMNISNWEMALDSRFVRIHRSYLVNKAHISKITPTKLWICDKSLEVSRKYRDKISQEVSL